MIRAVDHINLVVSNLERSVRFYTELLGFKEMRRASLEGDWIEAVTGLQGVRATSVYLIAPAGEPRLELLCYESPQGEATPANSLPNSPGLRHLAFRVDDIQTAAKRLKEADVRFLGGPVTVPPSAVKHDAGHKTLCYFLDPDGAILEMAEYK